MSTPTPRSGARGGPAGPAEAAAGRIYSGQVPSERVLARRGRLLAAGLELFGTRGFAHVKIKELCQHAGVSERYFYESFRSREELLTVLYAQLTGQLMVNFLAVMRVPGKAPRDAIHAGITAVASFMLNDPRHAQIILVEIVGVTAELEAMRHASLRAFAAESMVQLLRLGGIDPEQAQAQQGMDAGPGPLARSMEFARLTAVSSVGAINNMLLDALLGGTTANTDPIIEVALELMCNAANGIRALANPAM